MKANEFVKKFGVVQSKYHLSFMLSDCQPLVLCDCILPTKEVWNLKRLVESHDLVQLYGGLESSKLTVNYLKSFNDENVKATRHRLSKAIADIESCQ